MPYSPAYALQAPEPQDLAALAGITVVEFGAPWCGHCQGIQTWLQAVLDGASDVRHIKIEDGKGKRLGRSYGVKLWPTLVVLLHGHELGRLSRPSQAQALIDMLSATRGAALRLGTGDGGACK